MQTEADAERLANLGLEKSKIFVTGNVKFDTEEIGETIVTEELRARFAFNGNRKLIIAASTHAPEENRIIRAFAETCEQFKSDKPRLLIVPRHPERFAEVAQIIEKSGFSFAKRSATANEANKSADIILLDSIGELRQVLPLAEIVFVGGSLIKHGGQNILEPAAARKPIITGFYTFNFKAIVEEFLETEALVRLPEVDEKEAIKELSRFFVELLQDKNRREKLAVNAFQTLQKNRGATAKTVENLHKILG
jgi:3-deoxy-D-manno-octulosonic-acid transferase